MHQSISSDTKWLYLLADDIPVCIESKNLLLNPLLLFLISRQEEDFRHQRLVGLHATLLGYQLLRDSLREGGRKGEGERVGGREGEWEE